MLSFEIGGLDLMRVESVKATIKFAGDDLFIAITPSGHALTLDTDHVRSSAPTPVELLLVALGSCTAVDVISILSKKREKVTSYKVEVTGERREDHPRSFKSMKVHHILKGLNISAKSVAQAIELSETKYCSVAATLRPSVEIRSTFETIEDTTGE
jgi:putative redox protein